jgi:hypothetical protein
MILYAAMNECHYHRCQLSTSEWASHTTDAHYLPEISRIETNKVCEAGNGEPIVVTYFNKNWKRCEGQKGILQHAPIIGE